MSAYVQRCQGKCRRVLGKTSFAVLPGGGRSATCRGCDEELLDLTVRSPKRRRRLLCARLGTLAQQRSQLKKKLARIERESLAVRLELERAS